MESNGIKLRMGLVEWAMLIALSMLWGGSYFFVEIALTEWSPLLIVGVRVVVATFVIWAIVLAAGWSVPRSVAAWKAFFVMGLLNNVLPFLLIVWGQKEVASGLAAILNAAAPIFTVIVAGIFLRDEQMTTAKLSGAVLGLIGVAILIGPSAIAGLDASLLAQIAILAAALSYAFAGVYVRRFLEFDVNPIVVAAGQLLMSSLIMTVLILAFDTPARLLTSSAITWGAVGGMAVFSTALAYILYFRLIATAGATNAVLVTLLIPITAILLGSIFLGERLHALHFAGMAVVGIGLLVIDGRVRLRRAILPGLGALLLLAFAYSIKSFTPPIFHEDSIAELRALDVNGDTQYVLVRGANKRLPVLLFIHGGPGMPAMYLAHDFQRELEAQFVVVHWDQRASGKSFKADADPGRLSTSLLLDDMDVVVDYLRDELGSDRLWIVGHSHGSYLGVLYARRNEAKVCAFVGIGQVSNNSPTGPVFSLQTKFLENRRAELGLDADTAIDATNLEDLLFRSGSELHGETSFVPLLLSGLMATEYSLSDSLNVAKGSSFSSRHMKFDMPRDLLASEWRFDVPVALIMGRHDMVTPTQLAREYFDRIEAPVKAWFEFQESAHFPHFEKPGQFTGAMSQLKASWGDCPGSVTSPPE